MKRDGKFTISDRLMLEAALKDWMRELRKQYLYFTSGPATDGDGVRLDPNDIEEVRHDIYRQMCIVGQLRHRFRWRRDDWNHDGPRVR
jgi:hypothetical protein